MIEEIAPGSRVAGAPRVRHAPMPGRGVGLLGSLTAVTGQTRARMTGYQRVCGWVALAGGIFILLVTALPSWTVTAADGDDERVAWWDPVLVQQHGNPLPLVAFGACLLGVVLVTLALLRRRPSWLPMACYVVALACSVAGVLVEGRWFLVINAVGTQTTVIAMTLLMAYTPRKRDVRLS